MKELIDAIKEINRWYPRGWSLELDVAMTKARAAVAKAEAKDEDEDICTNCGRAANLHPILSEEGDCYDPK